MADATDRRNHITKLLQHSLISWSFMDAIRPGITPGHEWDSTIDAVRSRAVLGRSMTRGEYGCVLSHRCIWEQMVANSIPALIILEDDALLDAKWYQITLEAFQAGGFDVLLLGYSKVPRKKSYLWFMSEPATSLVRLQKHSICIPYRQRRSGTVGYVVTLQGAVKLLNCQNPITTVADDWPYYEQEGVIIKHLRPSIVYEDCVSFGSSLVDERSRLEGVRHGRMQIVRIVARIARGLYWRMLLFFGVRHVQ